MKLTPFLPLLFSSTIGPLTFVACLPISLSSRLEHANHLLKPLLDLISLLGRAVIYVESFRLSDLLDAAPAQQLEKSSGKPPEDETIGENFLAKVDQTLLPPNYSSNQCLFIFVVMFCNGVVNGYPAGWYMTRKQIQYGI